MPAEITHKSTFRVGPILTVIGLAFVIGYLLGVNGFHAVQPLPSDCPRQPVVVTPH